MAYLRKNAYEFYKANVTSGSSEEKKKKESKALSTAAKNFYNENVHRNKTTESIPSVRRASIKALEESGEENDYTRWRNRQEDIKQEQDYLRSLAKEAADNRIKSAAERVEERNPLSLREIAASIVANKRNDSLGNDLLQAPAAYTDRIAKRDAEKEKTTAVRAASSVKNPMQEKFDSIERFQKANGISKIPQSMTTLNPVDRRMQLAHEMAVAKAYGQQNNIQQPTEQIQKTPERMQGLMNYIDRKNDPEAVKAKEAGSKSWNAPEKQEIINIGDNVYQHMSQDEKDYSNYLAGMYGEDARKEYMDSITPELNKRMTEVNVRTAREYAKEHPVAGHLKAIGQSLAFGPAAIVKDVVDLATGNTPDQNDFAHQALHTINAGREGAQETIDQSIDDQFGKDTMAGTALKRLAKNVPNAIENTARNFTFGSAGIAMMALSAAGQAYSNEIQKGHGDFKALAKSLADGLTEAGTEAISFGKWEDLAKVPAGNWAELGRNLLIMGGTEYGEESIGQGIDNLTDILINTGDSDAIRRYDELKNNGMNDQEAVGTVLKESVMDMHQAGLDGFISGVMMGAAAQGNAYAQNRTYQQIYQNYLKETGKNQEFFKAAKDYQEMIDSVDPKAPAAQDIIQKMQEQKEKVENGEDLTDEEKGKLIDEIMQYMRSPMSFVNEESEVTAPETQETPQETAQRPQETPAQKLAREIAESEQKAKQEARQAEETIPAANVLTDEALTKEANRQEAQKAAAKEEEDLMTQQFTSLSEEGRAAAMELWNQEYQRAEENGSGMRYNLPEFVRAFNTVYDYASHEDSGKVERGMDVLAPAYNLLDEEGFRKAYAAGVHALDARETNILDSMQKVEQVGERKGSVINLTEDQTNQLNKIGEFMGKTTGLRFIVTDVKGSRVNGGYIRSAGAIVLNMNSKDAIGTLGHELSHYIQDYAPTDAEMYKTFVVSKIIENGSVEGKNGQKVTFEDLVERKAKAYKGQDLTRDELIDEVVADASTEFLKDEKSIRELCRENKSLGEKILDFINDMISAIRDVLGNGSITRDEARILQKNMDAYEQARQMYVKALKKASDNYKSGTEYKGAQESLNASAEEVAGKVFGEDLNGIKYKIADEDSEGNKLTEEQQEYFNDTKVVDKEGRLKVMYHGSPNGGFTTFKNHLNFFTADKQYAEEYTHKSGASNPQIYEVYLNIKHPFDIRNPKVKKIFDNEYVKGGWAYSIDPSRAGEKMNTNTGLPDWTEADNIYDFLEENEYLDDYDGIVVDEGNASDGKGGNRPAGVSYITFQSNQVKNITNMDPTSDPDIRYQIDGEDLEEVEGRKDLIALHNLDANKLQKVIDLGGFAMPSIAVTTDKIAANSNKQFGDITIVFGKDTIDPALKENVIYGADAWTPTFPPIEYDYDENMVYDIKSKLKKEMAGKVPELYMNAINRFIVEGSAEVGKNGMEGIVKAAKKNYGLKAAFLASKGENIDLIRREETSQRHSDEKARIYDALLKELGSRIGSSVDEFLQTEEDKQKLLNFYKEFGDEEYGRKVLKMKFIKYKLWEDLKDYQENGIQKKTESIVDEDAMNKNIDERIDETEFENWIKKTYQKLIKGKGVYNGKEYLTASGNRRSFNQLHYPLTIENVVKAMKQQNPRNASESFGGVKTIRAVAVPELKSIEDIRENKGKLKNLTKEEFKAIENDMNNRLNAIFSRVWERMGGDNEKRFYRADSFGLIIAEAAEKKKINAESVKKTFGKYTYWKVTDQDCKEIADIIHEAAKMPTNMFESKPARVVGFDEVKAAVVPADTDPELVERLKNLGINVIGYDAESETARDEAINSIPDVKFQLDDVDEEFDVALYKAENDSLRSLNDALQQQITLARGKAVAHADISKAVNSVLSEYESSYRKSTLFQNIAHIYNYLNAGHDPNADTITETMTRLGKAILRESRIKDDTMVKQYADLKKHLKTTAVSLAEKDRPDLDRVGGYQLFVRKNFGKLKITDKGTPVDTIYQELNEQYPEMFPADITSQADRLIQMSEVAESIKPMYSDRFSNADIDELAVVVGQKLLEPYLNAQTAGEAAIEANQIYRERLRAFKNDLKEKNQAAIRKVKEESREKIAELRKQYNEAKVADRQAIKEKMDNLRNEKNQKLRAKQERVSQRIQAIKDNNEAAKIRDRVTKNINKMRKTLAEPTDQNHIPEVLRAPVANILSLIDTSSAAIYYKGGVGDMFTYQADAKGKLHKVKVDIDGNVIPGDKSQRTVAWLQAKEFFEQVANSGNMIENEDGTVTYVDLDPSMNFNLNELQRIVEESKKAEEGYKKLDEMNLYELQNVEKVVNALKSMVQYANALRYNEHYKHVDEAADAALKEFQKIGDKKISSGFAGTLQQFLNYDMLDPYTFFSGMGKATESLYQELRNGLDEKTRKVRVATDYMKNLLKETGFTYSDIHKMRMTYGQFSNVKTYRTSGGSIEMTPAEVMSLYMLNKRKQAQGHIYDEDGKKIRNGGFRTENQVVETKYGKKLLGFDKLLGLNKEVRKSDVVTATRDDIEAICAQLTPQEKKLAEGIGEFFTKVTSDWGNKVSMELYGYNKFGDKNYFPIRTDKNYLPTTTDSLERTQERMLKNMSAAQKTVNHARTPIIVEDIFTVFFRHVDEMSSYNAYVIPISDFQKFYNYRHVQQFDDRGKPVKDDKTVGSVKNEIERAFGAPAKSYIEDLLRDVNGARPGTPQDILEAIMANMKANAVGANVRVAIQQPTAIARAMDVIDAKYLIKGVATRSISEEEWERCKEYAPIAAWKEWGGVGVGAARSMESILLGNTSIAEDMQNLKDGNPEGAAALRSKSMILAEWGDEFTWKRIWMACLAETDDLHKDLEKGSEKYYKQAAKRFNQIIDQTQVVDSPFNRTAIMKKKGLSVIYTPFMAEPSKSYNMLYRAYRSGDRKKLGKAVAVFLINAALTAVAQSTWDAIRRRDKNKDKNYLERWIAALPDNFIDDANVAKSIPYVQDIIETLSGDTVERQDLTAFSSLFKLGQEVAKFYEGKSKYTTYGFLNKTMEPLSVLSGIPANNLLRDAGAIVDNILELTGARGLEYAKGSVLYAKDTDAGMQMFIPEAMAAYIHKDQARGDQIIDELTRYNGSKVASKAKAWLKTQPNIIQAAEAKRTGDFEKYEKIVKNYVDLGINRNWVIGAISNIKGPEEGEEPSPMDRLMSFAGRVGKTSIGSYEEQEPAEEKNLNLYSGKDVAAAVGGYSKEEIKSAQAVVDQMAADYRKTGKTNADAKEQIKKAIKAKYQPEYKQLDLNGRNHMINALTRLSIGNTKIFTEAEIKKWLNDDKKKK